jgi:hypothetical protein
MAEQQKATEVAKGESRVNEGSNAHEVTQKAPRGVGRHQIGEKIDAAELTTRVPRGVGEAPADAKAEHAGVRLTQETVEKQVNADSERGYRGESVSAEINDAYTLKGVTSGAPTPETVVYTPRGK